MRKCDSFIISEFVGTIMRKQLGVFVSLIIDVMGP
jgi:hypothetical protein